MVIIAADINIGGKVWDALVSLGVLGMGMIAPVMVASIAYSIADRPGIKRLKAEKSLPYDAGG